MFRRFVRSGPGLAAVLAVAVIAAGAVATDRFAPVAVDPAPAGATVSSLDDAVALGALDADALRELRSGGSVRATIHLDAAALLEGVRRRAEAAGLTELLDRATAAFAAAKAAVLSGAGRDAAVARDFEHLGAVVATIRSEATLLRIVQNPLVRYVAAPHATALTPTDEAAAGRAAVPLAVAAEGAGVAVGVLDTGADAARYPEYFPAGSVAAMRDIAPDDGSPDDGGHGTHVSSIVLQVAPKARLYVADVFARTGTIGRDGKRTNLAADEDTLAGMDWLIGLRREGVNLRAVNLSLGSGHYGGACVDIYHFTEALGAGILPVVASGNAAFEDDDGNETDTYQPGMGEPACVPGALAVGAVTDGSCGPTDTVDRVAFFSQSSDRLGMLAPGFCIVAAGGKKSGTSMAAPHVTGAVAVLASARDASAEAIRAALTGAGPSIVDPNSGIVRHRLDVAAAVDALLAAADVGTAPVPEPPARLVSVALSRIDVPDGVAAGAEADGGLFGVTNGGRELASYRIVVSAPGLADARDAPADWLRFDPSVLFLAPGSTEVVRLRIVVPGGAAPGDYAADVGPQDIEAAVTGGGPSDGAVVRVRFTVAGEAGPSWDVIGAVLLVGLGLFLGFRSQRSRRGTPSAPPSAPVAH